MNNEYCKKCGSRLRNIGHIEIFNLKIKLFEVYKFYEFKDGNYCKFCSLARKRILNYGK